MKWLVPFAVALTPAAALACPYCARGVPPAMSALIGAILILPFGIAWAVVHYVRTIRDEEDPSSPRA
jgi:hypothetical protein